MAAGERGQRLNDEYRRIVGCVGVSRLQVPQSFQIPFPQDYQHE